jgi:hypothetical protein
MLWSGWEIYSSYSTMISQAAHVCQQRWLITDGGWVTTEQRRHLGTSLCETENAVDEEKCTWQVY